MDSRKYQPDVRCDELRTSNEETNKMSPSNVEKDYVGSSVKINFTSNLDLKDKEQEVNPWGEKRRTHCKLTEDTRSAHDRGASEIKNQFDKSMSLTQVNLPGSEQEILLSSQKDLHDKEKEKAKGEAKGKETEEKNEKDSSQMNQMSHIHVTCAGGYINAPSPQQQSRGDSKRIDLPPLEKFEEKRNPDDGSTSRGSINMNSSSDQRRSTLEGAHISAKREQYVNKVSTNLGTWCNRDVCGNDEIFCTRGVTKEGAHLREAIRVPSIGAHENADEEAQKECTVVRAQQVSRWGSAENKEKGYHDEKSVCDMVQGGSSFPHSNVEQQEQRNTNLIIQPGLNEVKRNNCMNRSGSYMENGEKHDIYEQSYVRSSNFQMNLVSEGHLDREDRRGNVFPGDDSDWVSILSTREIPSNGEDRPRSSSPLVKDIAHLRENLHGEEKTRKINSEEDKTVDAIFYERYIPPVSSTCTRETIDNTVETNISVVEKERLPEQMRVDGATRKYNPRRDLSAQRSEDNLHTIHSLLSLDSLHGGNQDEDNGGKSPQVGCKNMFVSIGAEVTEKWTAKAPNGGTPKLSEQVGHMDNQLEISNGEIKEGGKDILEGYPSGEGHRTNVGESDLSKGPNGAASHERVSCCPYDVAIGMISSRKIEASPVGGKDESDRYRGIENERDAHLEDGNEERFSCAKGGVVGLYGGPSSAPLLKESSQEGTPQMGSAIRIRELVEETAHKGVTETSPEEEGKKKNRSPEMCKGSVDLSNKLDDESRGKLFSPSGGSQNGFTSEDVLRKGKYSTDNQFVGVVPRTLVSLGYTPDEHGVALRTSRTRFGERKGIHMVDAKWSQGDTCIMDNYHRSGNIPMGRYPDGHEQIVAHRNDDHRNDQYRDGDYRRDNYTNGDYRKDNYSSFEKEMNDALLYFHKDGVDMCKDNLTHFSDCKKKKKRTGIPLNERKYYRMLAKQMIKIQGLTFDHNQIRWIAYWKNENNKQIQKHFPVCKYGFYKARHLALEFRNSKFAPGSQTVGDGAVVIQGFTISEVDKPGVNPLGVEEAEAINYRVNPPAGNNRGVYPPQSSKKSSHKKDVATPKSAQPPRKGSQTTETHTKNKRKDAKVGIHNPRKRSRISSRRAHLSVERGESLANPSHAEGTMKQENQPKNVDAKSNLIFVNKRINTCKESVYEENSLNGRSAVGSFYGGGYAGITRHDLKNVQKVLDCQNGDKLSSIQNSPHSTISQGFTAFMGNRVVGDLNGLSHLSGLSGMRGLGGCIEGSGHIYDQGNYTTTDGQPPNRQEYARGSCGSVNFYDQNGIIITGPHNDAWDGEHGRRNNYSYMMNNFEAMQSGHSMAMSAFRSGLPSEVAYLNHGISGEVLSKGQFTDTYRNVAYQNQLSPLNQLNQLSLSNQVNPFFGANYRRNLQTVTDAGIPTKCGGHTQTGNYIDGCNFNNADMKKEGGETYSPRFIGVQSGSPQHMRNDTYQYSMNEGRTQNMGPHFNSTNKVVHSPWNSPYEEKNGAKPSDNLTSGVKNGMEGKKVRSSAISSGSCGGGMESQGIVKLPRPVPEGDNLTQNKQKEDLSLNNQKERLKLGLNNQKEKLNLSLNLNIHSRVSGERNERETWNLTRASTATHISEHLSELINVNRSVPYEGSQGRSLLSEGSPSGKVVGLRNTGEETTQEKENVLRDNAEAFGRRINSPEQWISIQPMEKTNKTIKNASVESGEGGKMAYGRFLRGVTSAYLVNATARNQEGKTAEGNVSGQSKRKKNNCAKRSNIKGGKSCNDSHTRGDSISVLSGSHIVSRSCQWYGEQEREEMNPIDRSEQNQGKISNGSAASKEVSKTKSRRKSAKRKKEKNELDIAGTSGKQKRSECSEISDAKNKGSEEVSSEISNPNKWTHSMSLIRKNANLSEEPKKAAMYEENNCTGEKQLDPCSQLNQLTVNTPFCVSIGESSVPRCVFNPNAAKYGEHGSEKGSNELAKKETAQVEEGQEEMYKHKLTQFEKNSCNDHDEDEYYYNEIMKMPKIKGVHFDIRQKRWCAYGHKKKECFSVYRYGFLIARELAVKSRLKVQKRKNHLKLKKNKNFMNSENGCSEDVCGKNVCSKNVCGKNGVSPVKKQNTVGDKKTHSSEKCEVSHLPYDGLDRNNNTVGLNDYTSPPSSIGSAECTPTSQFNDQKGDPMGISTPTGESKSHEDDKQNEVMNERSEHWDGTEMKANLFAIMPAHSHEMESLKGPSVSGSKLLSYSGRGASGANSPSAASGTYRDKPYEGHYASPDWYANRSYTGVPSQVESPTRRFQTEEVGSRSGSGTNDIVPPHNMVHHSEKERNCSYPGKMNRISNIDRAQEPFQFYGPNDQICLNGQVKNENFYGAYNTNGETNEMIQSNAERGINNFVNMRNVERCVLRGPNVECQWYNGDVSSYNVARGNVDMHNTGTVPIATIPIGCVPVRPLSTSANGAIKSNAINDEERNRSHRIALLNDGHFANSREQVMENEAISTQGDFPLGVSATLPADANKTCAPEMHQRKSANNKAHRNGITDRTREFVHNRGEVSILEPVVESKPNKMRLKKDVVPNGYWSFINNYEKGMTVGSDQRGGTNVTNNAMTSGNSASIVNDASVINRGAIPFFEGNGGIIGGATPVGADELATPCSHRGRRSGVSNRAANGAANRIDGTANVGGHFLGLSLSPQHTTPQKMLPQFPHANSTQGPCLHSWGTPPGKNIPSANMSKRNSTQSGCDTSSGMNANQWANQKNRGGQKDTGRVINMSETNYLQNDLNRGVVQSYSAMRSVEPFEAHNLMRSTTGRCRNVERYCAEGRMTSCLMAEEKIKYGVGKEPHPQYDGKVARIGSGYSEYDMNPSVDVNESFAQIEENMTLARRDYGRHAIGSPFDEQGKNETDKHLDENEKIFLHQIFQDNRNIGHIEVDIRNKSVESHFQRNKRLNFEEVNMFQEEVREPVVSENSAGLAGNEHRDERDSSKKWVQVNGKTAYYNKADVRKTDKEATNKGVKIMKPEKRKKKRKEHIKPQSVDPISHLLDVAHVKCEAKQTRNDKNKRSKSGFASFRDSNETCGTTEGGTETCLLPVSTLERNKGIKNEVVDTQGTASTGSPIGVHIFKCHTNRNDAGGRGSNVTGKYKFGKEINAQLSNSRQCEKPWGASLTGVELKGRGPHIRAKMTPKVNMMMLDRNTTGEEEEKYSELYPRRRSNFPLLENKTSEIICEEYDPYSGMVITTQGGSYREISPRQEERWDPFLLLEGTDKGGPRKIICDDHGKVVPNGGLPYVDCLFTFSKTNGASPQSCIKFEELKNHQISRGEESQTVSLFGNRYGREQSGHHTKKTANGLVLREVDVSSANLSHLSANRRNYREVNRWDVVEGVLRDGKINGGFPRATPNCHLGGAAAENASTEDVNRFEADRMMAAAEVFLNGDYFDVCGDVSVAKRDKVDDPVDNTVVSELSGGGHSEGRSRHSLNRDRKKGTILKTVHILEEYGERFPHKGSEEGAVPYDSAVDGNKSGVDSLLDRYCLSIFERMKISGLMPMHCGDTEIEEVLSVEPYREYACLSLHDLNINRAKDVNQTIHFKKLILKYLIMDLFRNISVVEFSKMTNNRTHFFVDPQRCASSYPLTDEIDKNRDLLQRAERYHLKCVNNIYDMKFVQLYWDVFVTCLVKNVTASVLPFEEHCMVMRSLLLLYQESCASGG
ncbi:hypothetical protein C922_04783 [Plasmodium inui San Antonio 1]|uniref:AP2/ERF domain-containing protein n=1 Tax=Plasmodium inui San Antonio 1 TaxID=1237626 RepID=W7AHU0_9APIC|nr:hypothetical protein C922_04783 [Plasmodium inui San Antonio 1]EUD64836.1 hypothetical protein C922_04783 [Plasmodium inui San Antonio 1]